MKMALGAIRDLSSASQLSTMLIRQGCLADQLVFISSGSISQWFSLQDPGEDMSLSLLDTIGALHLWGLERAELYEHGVKVRHSLIAQVNSTIKRFDDFGVQHSGLSFEKYLAIYPLMAVVQLSGSREQSIANLQALLKYSHDYFHALDIPDKI